ncbi:hypothetical protein LY78DRAFT_649968 [Colletotrichum sublineola]|nr:hypothetical protein LY78DRAFT_649968 [Colletotrichum sublineola]
MPPSPPFGRPGVRPSPIASCRPRVNYTNQPTPSAMYPAPSQTSGKEVHAARGRDFPQSFLFSLRTNVSQQL